MTWLAASLKALCCLNVVLVSLCLLKSDVSLKEKIQSGLNVAFYSKVARSCEQSIDIIKLKATL